MSRLREFSVKADAPSSSQRGRSSKRRSQPPPPPPPRTLQLIPTAATPPPQLIPMTATPPPLPTPPPQLKPICWRPEIGLMSEKLAKTVNRNPTYVLFALRYADYGIWGSYQREVLEPGLAKIDALFARQEDRKEYSIPIQYFKQFASVVAERLPRFLADHVSSLVDVVYYRCHHALRSDPRKTLKRIKKEFQDQEETPLLLQVHFGCSIESTEHNIVLDYGKFAENLAANFYRQKNYFLRKAGHIHGADKLAHFPRISYAHSNLQQDKFLTRHNARANEVLVLALTRGTSFEEKCKDTIRRLKQLFYWYDKAQERCVFRFEIVENFRSLASLNAEALKESTWKAADVPLQRCQIPGERSTINEVMDELYHSRTLVLILHWKGYLVRSIGPEMDLLKQLASSLNKQVIFPKSRLAALNFAAEKITCFIEGTRDRYDADLLHPMKRNVDDSRVQYHLYTQLLDKSFFEKRQASFNYLGGHAQLYMKLLYSTAGDDCDLISLDVNYVVDRMFRLVAFWRRYRMGGIHLTMEKIDIAHFSSEPKADTSTIFCSVDDVVKSLMDSPDNLRDCLIASAAHFVRENVRRWPLALVASSRDWSKWAGVVIKIQKFNHFHCFVTRDLRHQLQCLLYKKAKNRKEIGTDTGVDAGILRLEAMHILDQEEIIDQIIADAREEKERLKRQEQSLQTNKVKNNDGDRFYTKNYVRKRLVNIDFTLRTHGYKDEPKLDEDGNPLLLRTTPLHHAIYKSNKKASGALIGEMFKVYDRFDLNYVSSWGLSHFHVASMYGCESIVEKFLEHGHDPNLLVESTGASPLHLAANYRHRNAVELLLRRGADPNLADADGSTPLHYICKGYNEDDGLMRMFFEVSDEIQRQVRVDARDKKGKTPLHWALRYGNVGATESLLRRGADANLADETGSTALHWACQTYWVDDAVEIFFKTNKEVNQLVQVDAQDQSGRTPLQWAVAKLMPNTVDALLDNGADLSSFVFPTPSYFAKGLVAVFGNPIFFHLRLASSALIIVENLEQRGYELDLMDAATIMKLFTKFSCFLKSFHSDLAYLCNDQEFTRKIKEIMMSPNLSLYDLVQLRPEEAVKLFSPKDYYELTHSKKINKFRHQFPSRACVVHLCDIMSRRFFRRWALDSLLVLMRCRLPLLCCDMIIDNLEDDDVRRTCLAAAGQSS
ncbi:unnamed protein product [Trichogramma brassicae]|uniref:Uncharacterized protein n=1 Tax=Trichogramma brassicae TaxID=86971 RepID=A0A6H5J9M4_9HYME|nr:unnamed protein product [Trichogramma brassicae]